MSNSAEGRTASLTVKERVVAVLRRLDESCRECRRRGMAGTRCLDCDLDGISATLADAVRCGGDDWCGDEADTRAAAPGARAGTQDGAQDGTRYRGKPMSKSMAAACEAVLVQLGVWGEMESVEIAEVVRGVDARLVPAYVIKTLSRKKKMARCHGSKTKYGRGSRGSKLKAVRATEGANQDGLTRRAPRGRQGENTKERMKK
jgi:hypothetical protein